MPMRWWLVHIFLTESQPRLSLRIEAQPAKTNGYELLPGEYNIAVHVYCKYPVSWLFFSPHHKARRKFATICLAPRTCDGPLGLINFSWSLHNFPEMLLSPVPHRGSNIHKHTLLAGFKPCSTCCLVAKMAWIFPYYPLFYIYLLVFLCVFFSLSFLLLFSLCPVTMKPKSMRTRTIWFPAGVRGSDPLWVLHVGLVKWGADFNVHTSIKARMLTLFHRFFEL